MRKIIFTILLACSGLLTNAQIKKGSTLLGGQLSIYNRQYENVDDVNERKTSLISASVGRAVKENTVVGIDFGYSWDNSYYSYDSSTLKFHQNNIGAFFRKYKRLGKDFYVFGQVDGSYITSDERREYQNPDNNYYASTSGGRASVSLGLAYNIFKKMQVELTLPGIVAAHYTVTKYKKNIPTDNSKSEEFYFNSNLTNNNILGSLSIGFRFVL
jgi:hypothetical protein